ncbi:hypothetical protein Ahy_A05g025465 isoform C [Arachis hypogaea]|uniref:Uncharacterized protein n=1 Tax=Arachis hypogaea TaxID=3818 RepID=A0A445D8T2_ARAHY|nr:hypothetical protein Ahy_A05g025465 isoform C [Arachis hypogaea]
MNAGASGVGVVWSPWSSASSFWSSWNSGFLALCHSLEKFRSEEEELAQQSFFFYCLKEQVQKVFSKFESRAMI